jgi:hypothetical protein
MRIRLRNEGSVIELECDAYALFDSEAMLLIVSDHTLIDRADTEGFEIVWIV